MAGPGRAGQDLLRIVTCGSVDDGKSTLIGRLLHDAGLVPEDELARLGRGPDLAHLLDGLEAEREQGITIDVAWRHFATPARRFLVADTPGHEQYTRNTATGASVSDLAVVLVDARKGILPQTRRHALLLTLFGVRRMVLAVNKMDLRDWDEEAFAETADAFRRHLAELDADAPLCIPVSATRGGNVVHPADETPWYRGPTLLEALEAAEAPPPAGGPFRMPVQRVSRDGDFRGLQGSVASGAVRPGDAVAVHPSGAEARIARVLLGGNDAEAAETGDAVTLVLDAEVDAGRGDVIAAADAPPLVTDQFAAHVLWMGNEPLLPHRRYLLRAGTAEVPARVTELRHEVNVDTLERMAARSLRLNGVGRCHVALDRALALDVYRDARETGGFVLVDPITNATIGAGTVERGLQRAANVTWQRLDVDREARAAQKGQKPCVLWLTGLSGAGKTTVANAVERRLLAMGRHSYLLDGDNVRHGINRDLGFADADRVENARRVAEVAKLFLDAGLIVLVAFISPFRNERRMARDMFAEGEFLEIFVDAPLEVCEARDPKGLYRKARAGEIRNFTGIDSAYEPPERPDIVLPAAELPAEELADLVIERLREGGHL